MTNRVDGGSGHPLDGALSALADALDQLADLELWQLSEAQLRQAAAGLDRAGLLSQAQQVRLLGEVDARGLPGQDGTGSPAGWLRSVVPTMRPAEASGLGKRAERLYRSTLARRPRPDPGGGGGRAGAPGQERVISQTIEQLSPPTVPVDGPHAIDPQDVARAQTTLVSEAARFAATDLAKLAVAVRHHLDPAADDRLARDEAAQQRQRTLTVATEASGMVFLQGSLTPECGAALRTAIDAWSAPQPAADGTPDPRTGGQRRHDALHHLADTALANGEVPTTHGSPAKIIVRVDLETLATALTPPGPAGDAGDPASARDAGGAGSADAAGGPEAARQPTSGEPWRAVGRGQPPTRHPSPPELADGTPLSRQTLARLACTADLVPILIDELGNPLDVGRTHRLFTPKQHTALTERDRHCTWPGCTAPAAWTDAHHLTPWHAGGRTDLTNAALLCGRHHRHVHATGTTGRVIDGRVVWDTTPSSRHAGEPTAGERVGHPSQPSPATPPVIDHLLRRWVLHRRQ